MSYHDQHPDSMRKGIAVVNPLIRIEKKLKKVQDVLKELSISDLKIKEFSRIKIGE